MPSNYYDDLSARWALDDAVLSGLQNHGLLYDRDEAGDFRHLYTDAFHDRFFFEVVERQAGYCRLRRCQCLCPNRSTGAAEPRCYIHAVTGSSDGIDRGVP